MKKLNFYFSKLWTRFYRAVNNRQQTTETPPVTSPKRTVKALHSSIYRHSSSIELTCELEEWLLGHYDFRFNLLTETTEYKQKKSAKSDFLSIDNRRMNGFCIDARKAGINCWDRDISRFINSSHIPAFHPFRDFMDSLPVWDGVERIIPLASRISEQPLWCEGFHRWMLAMVAQWLEIDNQHGNSVAPVLVSRRQGKYKSTFCKLLIPEALQAYYTDSFDLTALSSAEQKLSFFGLINLDEFDKFTPRKMALLKNVMQMAGLNIRKAYKKSFSALPRMASFIATSNQKELLTDPTGSRRFLCVEIEKTIDCTPPDHAQIYAQLKTELLAGERYWFSAEEEIAIRENNLPFQKRMMEEDVFFRCFRPATREDETPQLLTAAEIYQHLKKQNPSAMLQTSPIHFGRFLTALGIDKTRQANNTVYRVVEVTTE